MSYKDSVWTAAVLVIESKMSEYAPTQKGALKLKGVQLPSKKYALIHTYTSLDIKIIIHLEVFVVGKPSRLRLNKR